MIGGMEHLPTTEAAVTALRALADRYGREIEVTHDIGADQTSRRTTAGVGVTTEVHPDDRAHSLAERPGAVTGQQQGVDDRSRVSRETGRAA